MGPLTAVAGGGDAGDAACVGNVEGCSCGVKGDAVGLGEGVVDEDDGACVWVEAVGGDGELRRGVGEAVVVAVQGVGEEDLPGGGVDGEVVDVVDWES